MDFTSIIGMVAAFGLMIYGMVNGHDFSVIVDNFVDIPSVYIVFGGVLGCAFAGNSLKGFLSGLKSISLIFKNPKSDEAGTIKSIIELSNLARREGLLALEESANNLEDEFMKKGIMLIVDGTDPELVRSIFGSRTCECRFPASGEYYILEKYCICRSCLGYDWYVAWID
mgnify:CR=1 FL=1